jgi:AcrR family transcriptional regulator
MTVSDINYDRCMARWEPGSRSRLEQAAFELYGERGFERTTVAEIAERAGLTERTFFRHYADKREVLFAGSAALQELLRTSVAEAGEDVAPIDAVAAAIEAAGEVLDERPERAWERHALIAANAELRERELVKLASLGAAVAAASLTSEAGIAVFKVAVDRWAEEAGGRSLRQIVRDSFDELKAVTAGG